MSAMACISIENKGMCYVCGCSRIFRCSVCMKIMSWEPSLKQSIAINIEAIPIPALFDRRLQFEIEIAVKYLVSNCKYLLKSPINKFFRPLRKCRSRCLTPKNATN